MRPFDPTAPLRRGVTLLEASAGTGKTWSITSLVLRLVVEEGQPIERVLVVTFTEAATADLRGRLRGRLREGLDALERAVEDAAYTPTGDGVLAHLVAEARRRGALPVWAERARAALGRFDAAPISTIHGFCRRALHANAFESGVDFEAELVDDGGDLRDDVVQDAWTAEVHALSDAAYCSLPRTLYDTVRAVATEAVADPDLALLPAVPPAVLAAPSPAEPDLAAWEAAYARARAAWLADREAAIAAVNASLGHLNGNSYKADRTLRCAAETDAWAAAGPHPPAPPPPYFCQGNLAAKTKKGCVTPTHPVFAALQDAADSFDAARDAVETFALTLLHRCVARVRERLPARKRALGVQSFDDLLRVLRDALADPARGPALAEALRERYRAALVDEFQDTDPVQWEIFRRVFAPAPPTAGGGEPPTHWLLLVGDPKQAIYSFRNADVFAYLAARETADERLALDRNHRSDQRLVDAVNHLFCAVDPPFAVDGIPFEPVHAAHGERLEGLDGAPLRVGFLPGDGEKPASKGVLQEAIPCRVAEEIAAFLASGARVVEDAGSRPVSPRDLAVLVRTNKQAAAIQTALRDRGVPSVLHGGMSVYASPEAAELQHVLAAALAPSDDRAVRTALATDLLGIPHAAERAALRAAPAAPSGAAPAAAPLGVGNALAEALDDGPAWDAWLDRLRLWSAAWRERGVMTLVRTLMAELELPARLLALVDGERRLTNLLHLAELLHAEELRGHHGPASLLAFFARARAECDARDDASQYRLESDADAVEIVTIHRCKGLQYGVTWCPYLWDGALLHPADKARPRFHDPATRRRALNVGLCDDGSKAAHQAAMERETYAENLRLLYVALTRARHRCTVYWGHLRDAPTSALAYLFHHDPAALPDARMHAAKARAGAGEAALRARVEAIAAASGGCVDVRDVAPFDPPTWSPPAPPASTLDVRPWDRRAPLDRRWRRASYSGLLHAGDAHGAPSAAPHAAPEEPVRDTDVGTGEPDAASLDGVSSDAAPPDARPDAAAPDAASPGAAPPDAASTDAASPDAPVPLADFPRGTRAGTFLHEALEHLDFRERDPAAIADALRPRLAAHGLDADRWADPLAAALLDALAAPMGGGAPRLCDLAPGDRLDELAFDMSASVGMSGPGMSGAGLGAGEVTAGALADALATGRGGALPADYPDEVRALRFTPFHGFVTGSIDLVFRWAGRWYVVDYKSNRLGAAAGDYEDAAILREMRGHHYFLQYHLYAVALHRWLRWRLPSYDYDRDFGGVRYLFLRGMSPGSARGVFADRPPRARIDAIDRLLGGPR